MIVNNPVLMTLNSDTALRVVWGEVRLNSDRETQDSLWLGRRPGDQSLPNAQDRDGRLTSSRENQAQGQGRMGIMVAVNEGAKPYRQTEPHEGVTA